MFKYFKGLKKQWLVVVLIFFMGVFIISQATNLAAANKNIFEFLRVYSQVLSLVQSKYVDEVDSQELVYGSIKGMLKTLDPFSAFMPPVNFSEMKTHTRGSFGGLGITISIRDGLLTVISPIEDTPAFRAGVQAGDRIMKIDGESSKGLDINEAVNKLRGEKGSTVTISVWREGEDNLINFTIMRDIIKIKSVRYNMLEDDIGYIRLKEFKERSGKEVEKALNDLEKQGMRALVLDLRLNPGGLMNVSFEVANKFISQGKLIVYTKGRVANQNMRFVADQKPSHPDFPLVLLVNKGSASASEIVTGAVQDWNRGVILGTQTFGKASVQSILSLDDRSGLRLTTAKYYTPKGRLIHGKGIRPDIEVEVSHKDQMKLWKQKAADEIITKTLEGEEVTHTVGEPEAKDAEEAEDAQLQHAIKVIKKQRAYQDYLNSIAQVQPDTVTSDN